MKDIMISFNLNNIIHISFKILIILIITSTFSLNAHHSRAEFNLRNDPEVLEGVLTEVYWRNPHTEFDVLVTNANGFEELWTVESWAGPFALNPLGVERAMFVTGQQIQFMGWPSNMRERYFASTNALLENDLEVVLNVRGQPTFSLDYVGGINAFKTIVDNDPIDAKEENLGFYRSWTYAGREYETTTFPYTDYSLEARESFDPVQSPILKCEKAGMPLIMNAPLGMQLSQLDNDTIQLDVDYFNNTRYIHLKTSEQEALPDPSPLGYSIGRWEDNTLHVKTIGINYPLNNVAGTPQGSDSVLFETFLLSEDQATLYYEFTHIAVSYTHLRAHET